MAKKSKGKRVSESVVQAIRAEPVDMPYSEIAEKYGVSKTSVHRYRSGSVGIQVVPPVPRPGEDLGRRASYPTGPGAPAPAAPVADANVELDRERRGHVVLTAQAPWGTIRISVSKQALLSTILDAAW